MRDGERRVQILRGRAAGVDGASRGRLSGDASRSRSILSVADDKTVDVGEGEGGDNKEEERARIHCFGLKKAKRSRGRGRY
jgi:hypothetical protein